MTNDDWRRAVDALEQELEQCSVQVIACIERQRVQSSALTAPSR